MYMCYLYHGSQEGSGVYGICITSAVKINVFTRAKPKGIQLTAGVVQTHTPLRAMVQVTCTLIHVLCRLLEACRHTLQV